MLLMPRNGMTLASVAGLAAAILAAAAGCTLDNPSPPELSGPSELATALELRANPDQLTADGFSSSVIEAVIRNPAGQREPGVEVLFDITSPGASGFFDLGNLAPLNGPRPVAGGTEAAAVSAVTDSNGVARVRYWAPFRTDQENDTIVTITGRPSGTNFNAVVLRSTAIFLRAADRPSFPGGETCSFIWEPEKIVYDIGESIAFTATQAVGASGHPIARYEWLISDGTTGTGRGIVHAFFTAGTHTIILVTHESITGAREVCGVTLDVFP